MIDNIKTKISEEAAKEIKKNEEFKKRYMLQVGINLAALKTILYDGAYQSEILEKALENAKEGIDMQKYYENKIKEIVEQEERDFLENISEKERAKKTLGIGGNA